LFWLKCIDEGLIWAASRGGFPVASMHADTPQLPAGTHEWLPGSAAELADVIVSTHHAYLRMALPRLAALLAQTTAGHGADHPELHELSRAFARYSSFVNDHIAKEERLIFPLLRRLGAAPDEGLASRLSEAIEALERTNDEARAALAYVWGTISGAIALPAYVAVPLSFPEYRGPMVGVQALLILAGILIMLYAGNSLTPAINAARDAGPEAQGRFERLHRRAVRLNGVVLVLGIGLLIGYATRPAPRTAGILEMTPAERVQYDARITEILNAIETRQAEQVRARVPTGTGVIPATSNEPERFPIDEATIRELVEIYAHRRKPPAGTPLRP
jgi:hypothetical protein